MKSINIFDVQIANITMKKSLELIEEAITKNEQRKMYFVNADCLNKVYKDPDYKKVLNAAKYIFGDGIGVKIGSKIIKNPIIDNVNGTDMLPLLCEQCEKNNSSIFLLGAKPGVPEDMKKNLENKFKKLKIASFHHGFFDKENESNNIVELINTSKADILLVAFGTPFQETWIHDYASRLNCSVLIGVGGLFDFFSGNMPRAPKWMRTLCIEWVYRLMQEPGRMWKRYILGNPLFIYRVIKWNSKK